MESPSKLQRDNTMQATAKEGIEYLQKNRPDLAEQCKTVLNEKSENGAGDVATIDNADSPTKLARDSTMVTTAEEGKEFLEKQGGIHSDAKTRSQEVKLNNSTSDDVKSTKRTAQEESKEVAGNAKKLKTDDDEEDKSSRDDSKKDK